jgi:hypothetical protein
MKTGQRWPEEESGPLDVSQLDHMDAASLLEGL